MIKYAKGDVTTVPGKALLMHVCNNRGGWGRGFVLALSRRWKEPERAYRQWYEEQVNFSLGNVQFVNVGDITVANMLAQDGYGGVAVKFAALRECLKKVAEFARKEGLPVVAPKIGTGLGGATWDQIEPIIVEELQDVTIYEL